VYLITVFTRANIADVSSNKLEFVYYLISLYLLVSYTLRLWNAMQSVKNSENIFDQWANKLHNHISAEEIRSIKHKTTCSPLVHFETVYVVIGAIQFAIAMLIFLYV
jgi:signal transduction histidine kinase